MRTKIKICGVVNPDQASAIAEAGADYVGCVVDFSQSPRSVSMERASEIRDAVELFNDDRDISQYAHTRIVGVVVNKLLIELERLIEETGILIWQLHGNEDEKYVHAAKELGVEIWKVVGAHCNTPVQSIDKYVVDYVNPQHGAGGSGQRSDWNFARSLREKGFSVVLSGGLNPDNVNKAVEQVRPDIIDLSSGVESEPGVKDMHLVEKLISAVNSIK